MVLHAKIVLKISAAKKISLFLSFPLDIISNYSIFGPVNERRQQNADVAQLDRAFGYEPKGSRFESWHPQKKDQSKDRSFFVMVTPASVPGRIRLLALAKASHFQAFLL